MNVMQDILILYTKETKDKSELIKKYFEKNYAINTSELVIDKDASLEDKIEGEMKNYLIGIVLFTPNHCNICEANDNCFATVKKIHINKDKDIDVLCKDEIDSIIKSKKKILIKIYSKQTNKLITKKISIGLSASISLIAAIISFISSILTFQPLIVKDIQAKSGIIQVIQKLKNENQIAQMKFDYKLNKLDSISENIKKELQNYIYANNRKIDSLQNIINNLNNNIYDLKGKVKYLTGLIIKGDGKIKDIQKSIDIMTSKNDSLGLIYGLYPLSNVNSLDIENKISNINIKLKENLKEMDSIYSKYINTKRDSQANAIDTYRRKYKLQIEVFNERVKRKRDTLTNKLFYNELINREEIQDNVYNEFKLYK